jgi:hypothetical protein
MSYLKKIKKKMHTSEEFLVFTLAAGNFFRQI